MAYCRMGEDSDVYLVRDGSGSLICFHNREKSFDCVMEEDMIEHLLDHKARGDAVPDRAIRRLEDERDGVRHRTDVELALDTMEATD